jgi:hypothetical protein
MTTIYRIPFQPEKRQTFSVRLTRDVQVELKFEYLNLDVDPCWIMDISDRFRNQLVCGIPLLPGQNLLEQYEYLDLGVTMFILNTIDQDVVPTWKTMGVDANLYFFED